jgi:hypothetical protein
LFKYSPSSRTSSGIESTYRIILRLNITVAWAHTALSCNTDSLRVISTLAYIALFTLTLKMTSPYLLRMFESFTENKVIIPESSLYDTVLIIALGQLTGWSADKISTTLYNSSKIEVTANQIWRFNYKFLLERKTGAVFNEEEMQTMQLVARNNGVPEELLRCRGVGVKKLTSTTAPIDMEFFQTGDQVSLVLLSCWWLLGDLLTIESVNLLQSLHYRRSEKHIRPPSNQPRHGQIRRTCAAGAPCDRTVRLRS